MAAKGTATRWRVDTLLGENIYKTYRYKVLRDGDMAGYMVYWPKDQVKKLQKEGDTGPISVVFGSIHSRMPTINSVQVGDIIFPVTLMDGVFCALARLPVEKIEPAYDYLVREVGNQCGALVPDGIDHKTYYNTPYAPHKYHQLPFNCCSKRAAQGTRGSSIQLRPIPRESIPTMLFGPTKAKQKALILDKKGNPSVTSLTSTRRMSDETLEIFEALFLEEAALERIS